MSNLKFIKRKQRDSFSRTFSGDHVEPIQRWLVPLCWLTHDLHSVVCTGSPALSLVLWFTETTTLIDVDFLSFSLSHTCIRTHTHTISPNHPLNILNWANLSKGEREREERMVHVNAPIIICGGKSFQSGKRRTLETVLTPPPSSPSSSTTFWIDWYIEWVWFHWSRWCQESTPNKKKF